MKKLLVLVPRPWCSTRHHFLRAGPNGYRQEDGKKEQEKEDRRYRQRKVVPCRPSPEILRDGLPPSSPEFPALLTDPAKRF